MTTRMAKLLVLAVALAASPGRAQETPPAPLNEAEFVTLVNAKTPEAEIIAQVRARGIAFRVSPELEASLKKIKLEALVAALSAPATLELHTNVPSAEVTVDGQKRDPVSQGQAVLAGFSPGQHVVRLQAEGYVSDTTQVFLKPGETRRLEMQLRPAVTSTPGPLGSRVNVQAGTSADAALNEIEDAKDAAARLALLDKFLARFQDSPAALLGYGLRQEAYLGESQFEQAIADGDELLRRDPRNFATHLRQVRAYVGKGDLETGYRFATDAQKLLEELGAAPAPAGAKSAEWEEEKKKLLESARTDWDNLAYTVFAATSRLPDPARKAGLLERFIQLFPDSPYRRSAFVGLAVASLQQGNAEAGLNWAERGLEADPNQAILIVLMADLLSDRGQNLGRARELVTRLLELLAAEPEKVRPEGLPEEQWAGQKRVWEGLAHSILGQVLMHEETARSAAAMAKTRRAIEEFRAAAPLLKADTYNYARNLYRLGFALQKVTQFAQAQEVLSEAARLDSPWRQMAGDLLQKVQQKLGGR